MKITKLLIQIIFMLSIGLSIRLSYAQGNIDSALIEANDKFTYQGKPIHPGLVQQFMSWMSDPGEPTIIIGRRFR